MSKEIYNICNKKEPKKISKKSEKSVDNYIMLWYYLGKSRGTRQARASQAQLTSPITNHKKRQVKNFQKNLKKHLTSQKHCDTMRAS